jgi:hypothetical protein
VTVGCPHCGQMLPIGQVPLTDAEKSRLPLGNQNTKWNIVRWRAVKGAAQYFDVSDWTAQVDPELSYDENIALMMEKGHSPNLPTGPTRRETARVNQ